MDVTLLGIVTEDRLEQSSKALLSMPVTGLPLCVDGIIALLMFLSRQLLSVYELPSVFGVN